MKANNPAPLARRWATLALLCALTLFGACDDDPQGNDGVSNNAANNAPDTGTPPEDTGNNAPDTAEEDTGDDPDSVDEPDGDEPDDLIPGTIVIEPSDLTVSINIGEQEQVTFTAMEVQEDGTLQPVTDAFWTSDNPRIGPMDATGGVLTTSGVGGEAIISVESAEGTARTDFRVRLEGAVLTDGITPEDAAALDQAEELEGDLEIVYPEDGTMFPQNIKGVDIRWTPTSDPLYRITFQNRFVNLTVYVRGPLSIWEPDEELWAAVIRSAIGRSIDVEVASGDGVGPLTLSAPVTLNVAEEAVFGAIYYWDTSAAGIMRLPVGEREPERFFTINNPPGSPCVGCHTLSNDGTRMAFNSGPVGFPTGPLMEVLVDNPAEPIIDVSQNINGMQPTFSPDGLRIVSGWQGTLTERESDGRCQSDMTVCQSNADCAMSDCVTGMPIRDLPSPAGYQVAFPNWSPDDRWLAAAGTNNPLGGLLLDFAVPNSSIILYPRPGGDWANPLIVASPANGNESHYNPAFSPDSAWIAYNFANGQDPNPDDNNDRPSAELRIMSPVERTPIILENANKGPLLSNSWPKWAPFTGRYLWLAFSSMRPIGLETRPTDTPQIWIAAIDPVKARNGEDPSFAAFWLPGQALDSGNHIPYWAVFEKEPNQE